MCPAVELEYKIASGDKQANKQILKLCCESQTDYQTWKDNIQLCINRKYAFLVAPLVCTCQQEDRTLPPPPWESLVGIPGNLCPGSFFCAQIPWCRWVRTNFRVPTAKGGGTHSKHCYPLSAYR